MHFGKNLKVASQFGTSQFGTLRASSERPRASSEHFCSELALGGRGLTPRASSERFFVHPYEALLGRPNSYAISVLQHSRQNLRASSEHCSELALRKCSELALP